MRRSPPSTPEPSEDPTALGPAPGSTGGGRRASPHPAPDARRPVPLLAAARRCRHDRRRDGPPPRDPRQRRRGRGPQHRRAWRPLPAGRVPSRRRPPDRAGAGLLDAAELERQLRPQVRNPGLRIRGAPYVLLLLRACQWKPSSAAIATSSRRWPRPSGDGAAIGRRAARRRGQLRPRRGVDQRPAARSTARSLLPRPNVGLCPPRRTTCGRTARRTRAYRPARTRAGPRSQPPRVCPKSQPPKAAYETGSRSGLGFELRGERRRWAIGEPTPGTPTLPRDRNSSPQDQRSQRPVAAARLATAQSHRAMR